MLSKGIDKMIAFIFNEEEPINHDDLKCIIGELMNRFGEQETEQALVEVLNQRQQDKDDHAFASQKDYEESNE
jgi:hypothetical protein